ncbi:MAG: hypothetical protein HYV07_25275 [Deltaproteobacteria bacterium]|nr:hypothetical protein [Deltaproteobacteria bacterium]
MKPLRIAAPPTNLELTALNARLERLGLKNKDGENIEVGVAGKDSVSEQSMSSVRGGAEAISALAGQSGVLDASQVATLRKQTNIIGRALGKDVPIRERTTRDVKSLAMEVDGLTGSIHSAMREVKFTARVSAGDIDPINRRLSRFSEQLAKLLPGTGAEALAHADPASVKKLAESFQKLAGATSSWLSLASDMRSELLQKNPDRFLDRVALNSILAQLFAGHEALKQVQDLATKASGSVVDPYQSLATHAAAGSVPQKGIEGIAKSIESLQHETKHSATQIAGVYSVVLSDMALAARLSGGGGQGQAAALAALGIQVSPEAAKAANEFSESVISRVAAAARAHPNDFGAFARAARVDA